MIEYTEGVFTDAQLRAFGRYKKVQASGEFNMLSPQAMSAVGCTKAEYLFIIENYEALRLAHSAWVLAERKQRGTD